MDRNAGFRVARAKLFLSFGSGIAHAADHGDPPFGFDVVLGFDLIEGPPYASAPTVIDVEHHLPPDPVVPLGRLLLTLDNAEGEPTSSELPITGSLVDNGDIYAEPEDTLTAGISFVPSSPPNDTYPSLSSFVWAFEKQDNGSGIVLEFSNAEPTTLSDELFFDSYFDADIVEAATQDKFGRVRVRFHFDVEPGQGLKFERVSSSPPDTRGAIGIRFEVNDDGSGASVDPASPLYTLTISAHQLESVPVLLPNALILLGALVLTLGLYATFRIQRPLTE